ncbi:MAG: N-acyl-D-amino-acid deacylase [Bacteroidetes bacterium]|nr:N-acyl-D-amino-acid deacylase [Bacteroidota bacterium]
MRTDLYLLLIACSIFLLTCSRAPEYDVIIRGGTVYDGTGNAPVVTDVAIKGDKVVAVGALPDARGAYEIDAHGLAVAPGFINMLSWANESLIEDGRSQSDIRQGVTLEIFGEGESMGPLNPSMKKEMQERQGDIKYTVEWTTLREYLEYLVRRGVSTNVASFVGAATIREYALGYDNRAPNAEELERMRTLVRGAMEDGALGVGSALIYAPGYYAKTDELIELCKVASSYGGMYISHLRSEGNGLLEAIDELLRISKEAKIPAEIYHLKESGKSNWGKIDTVIQKVEAAQSEGLNISANMYTYTAGATGLDASMPPWVQEGGVVEWIKRLKDPATRRRVVQEMRTPTKQWENLLLAAGTPKNVLLVGFRQDSLRYLTGKTLADVATVRHKTPEETAMDLVIDDDSRVGTIYFLMSEENVKKQIALPWVSFGSDEGSLAPEGVFLKSNPHPRAYGNVARLLGKYVRDEKIIPLEEAIRRLSSFPAEKLKIRDRGALRAGCFADVVVFDAAKIADFATFEKPHQFSTGMIHVFVNGKQVLKNGDHTGAKPGMVVLGPGVKTQGQ